MSGRSDILLLDLGNTRLHWQWGDQVGAIGADAVATADLPAGTPGAVAWSAVGDAESLRPLQQRYADVPWLRCERPDARLLPTRYNPERLGIDRWLGALAGARLSADCIVISAGTALTLDIVHDGAHLGGWIMPGYRLWQSALYGGTRIPRAPEAPLTDRPGLSTGDAIGNGWLVAATGAVQVAAQQLPGKPAVLLAGGDAELLATAVPEAIRQPNLVLQGLSIWAGRQQEG